MSIDIKVLDMFASGKSFLLKFFGTPMALFLLMLTLSGAVSFNSLFSPVFAKTRYTMNSYLNSAREPHIIGAFDLMAASSGQSALTLIVNRPIRVIFKDLITLDKRVKNYDALSYMTGNGQLMIYINQKHADAPPAALAAILSHEALHNDVQNSIIEEVAGWTQEAKVWQELKRRDPALQAIPKSKFPLVDRLNILEGHLKDGSLVAFVRNQPAYKGLAESSPGYAETVAIGNTEQAKPIAK